jgi:Fe-S oxidoreductase
MRKAEELDRGAELQRTAQRTPQHEAGAAEVKVLTSCPSCLQGLNRYTEDNAVKADYIVVELAKLKLGENWLNDFVAKATAGGIEKVLL